MGVFVHGWGLGCVHVHVCVHMCVFALHTLHVPLSLNESMCPSRLPQEVRAASWLLHQRSQAGCHN